MIASILNNMSQAGAHGLVYDGENLSDLFIVEDVSVSAYPTVEAVTRELAQRPGSYFASRKVATREIGVRLRLVTDSRDPLKVFQAWRALSPKLAKPEPRKLRLGEELHCFAMMAGDSGIEVVGRCGVTEVTFVCYDPYFYGAEHEVALSNNATAAFNVKGTEPAYPKMTLTAVATSVTATNLVTGDYVTVPGTKSGSRVTIDMERQLATIGGEFAPVNLLSDFFNVEGAAQVKVSGASGTLAYEERFL